MYTVDGVHGHPLSDPPAAVGELKVTGAHGVWVQCQQAVTTFKAAWSYCKKLFIPRCINFTFIVAFVFHFLVLSSI